MNTINFAPINFGITRIAAPGERASTDERTFSIYNPKAKTVIKYIESNPTVVENIDSLRRTAREKYFHDSKGKRRILGPVYQELAGKAVQDKKTAFSIVAGNLRSARTENNMQERRVLHLERDILKKPILCNVYA